MPNSFRLSYYISIRQCRIKKILTVLLFIFIASFSQAQVSGTATLNDSLQVLHYNQRALQLLNEYKFSESKDVLHYALEKKDNAISYYLLSHINNIEENWDEAIKNGEKAEGLDSNFIPVYSELFNAYIGAKKWQKAASVSDNAAKTDKTGYVEMEIKSMESSSDVSNISKGIVVVLLVILAVILLTPLYKSSEENKRKFENGLQPRLSEIIIAASAVSCVFWFTFFAFSRQIWATNPHYEPYLFMPAVRQFIFEHDGSESFVLYFMMFANILASLLLVRLVLKLRVNMKLFLATCIVLLTITGYYFFSVEFIPPIADIGNSSQLSAILFVIAIITLSLYVLYIKFPLLAKIACIVLIGCISLISIYPSSLFDLSFVLDPALRMMHGAKMSDIYFQYDIFLSLLAFTWMKLNFSLGSFAYLAQISFFLFFVGAFLFTDRFFKTKGLAVLFIVAIVLIRFYAVMEQGVNIFQVSPLRLDLWIIPLLFAWKKGIHHWLVGFSLGLLVLFHRNLGLIYLGAYAEMLVVLFLLELVPLVQEKVINSKNILSILIKQLRLNLVNLLLIFSSIVVCFILFKGFFSASALIYRTLGIGMLPISNISFYWYVPVLFTALVIFIIYYREKFSKQYLNTTLFIVFLAVGNSMYFFGRSHENNILNISGILILALFILFDVLISTVEEPIKVVQAPVKTVKNKKDVTTSKVLYTKKQLYLLMPAAFILLSGFYYSGAISAKTDIQLENFKEGQYICPLAATPTVDTAAIKQLTKNSAKVYFLDFQYDFYDYYYSNYAPSGYFSPAGAWVFKKDFITFLQGLLDDHYYIIYDARNVNSFNEYLPYLNYNRSMQKNNEFALFKDDVTFLLPKDTASVYHIALADTLANPGLDHTNVQLKSEFTIEIILKPSTMQMPNATIISELSQYDGMKGFTFQQNGNSPDQYVFAYSTGVQSPVNALIPIENNKWHYIAIVTNKQSMNIYDNGKLLSTVGTGGTAIVNSEVPLSIGNNVSRNSHFNGFIKEININEGNLNDQQVMERTQKIFSKINADDHP